MGRLSVCLQNAGGSSNRTPNKRLNGNVKGGGGIPPSPLTNCKASP